MPTQACCSARVPLMAAVSSRWLRYEHVLLGTCCIERVTAPTWDARPRLARGCGAQRLAFLTTGWIWESCLSKGCSGRHAFGASGAHMLRVSD